MDFNTGEIILLIVLGIVIFGPEKLPDLARKAARVLQYVRRIANDAKGQLREELGPEFANLKASDLNPKAFIAKHLGTDVQDDLAYVTNEMRSIGKDAPAAVTPAVPVPAKPTLFDPEAT
ncbi:MAG: sec-independent translocase [Micropruina sp.]|nr:Sec-independent protein translocase subunit TatB [Micropruina sp.]